MKSPGVAARPFDDGALQKETGRDRAAWFTAIDKSGASGRSAIGKFLMQEKVDAWWITVLTVDYEAARGIVEKDGRPKGYSLCITKTVAATPDRTFEAFTSSKDLSRWFGPATKMSAQPGGMFENSDGNKGSVSKIRPGKTVVFAWEDPALAPGSQVEVLVQPKGDKCGLVVNHTRVSDRATADAVRAAWDGALSRLKEYLD